jgi:MYXO-CTERM domain-containing protein
MTTINNTGEMDATLAFQSSDPQFVVTANAGAAAKTAYNLAVTFTPAQVGAASATVTVTSNDPNQPVQTIQVTATGVKEVTSTPPTSGDDAGAGDGGGNNDTPYSPSPKGCGCHVVDGGSPTTPLALLGFAMLGLGLVARRRR